MEGTELPGRSAIDAGRCETEQVASHGWGRAGNVEEMLARQSPVDGVPRIMVYQSCCSFPLLVLRGLRRLATAPAALLCAGIVALMAAMTVQICGAQAADRILQPVDDSRLQVLVNHRPHWAVAANDTGAAPADLELDHMTLVLGRSPEQEAAFEQLLTEQQNPASPEFHHWLTSKEVGARFGLSDHDLEEVCAWLTSEGLRVNWIAPSRQFIGFGGTAADIGHAFHSELHTYNVRGGQRLSVASDPLIPQALAPAVAAVRGLFSAGDRPAHFARVQEAAMPDFSNSGNEYLVPQDFSTIYNLPPSLSGAGTTIGIVGWSRVDTADLDQFRQTTGTNFANPIEVVPTAYGGVDPGQPYTTQQSCGGCLIGQEEATLDVQRAGSVAQGANLLLVVSSSAGTRDGIGADAQYLIQTSPAPAQVINISFGDCELNEGSSGVSYWNTLFEQAAAEGISVFVSSGDSGAAGCDDSFAAPPATPQAVSPNYICSSTYATCVGGTDFNDAGDLAAYWSASNTLALGSALGYIPEGAWNEPLDSSSSPQVAETGGGASIYIATPAWQQGVQGVPSPGTGRYTPDVSFSSSCREGYFGCMAAGGGSCVANMSGQYYFEIFCGTSAAAPSMAGVAALLDQKLSGQPQGNLNPEIYQLESNAPQSFNDVTVASSGVATCTVNTPSLCNNSVPSSGGLSGGEAGYLVGTGYDEATGLGSVNVQTFLDNYRVSRLTPTVTVSPSAGTISISQGLTVTVAVSGGSGNPTPTGSVTVSSGTATWGPTVLAGGSAVVMIAAGSLPTGTDTLTAVYTPDGSSSATYNGASGSNTIIVSTTAKIAPTVTVLPGSSNLTTVQGLVVTVNVTGGNGEPTPTGTVTLTSGSFQSASVALSSGEAVIDVPAGSLAAGIDTLSIAYAPDSSSTPTYYAGSGSNTVTVSKAAPVVTVLPSSLNITAAQSLQISVAVSGGSGTPTATGLVTVSSGTYSSAAVLLANGSASILVPAGSLAGGVDTVTVNYSPDAASSTVYAAASGSASVTVSRLTPTVVLSLSSNNITTLQDLSVAVTVNGNPAATGTVVLTSGSYSSGAITLSSGSATIAIVAGTLAVGNDMLTATYTPDSAGAAVYSSALGTNVVTVNKVTPTVTVLPGSSSATTTQSVPVTVSVSAGGGTPVSTGWVTLTNGTYSSGPMALFGGSTTITIAGGSLPTGADTLTASYTPDSVSMGIYNPASGTGSVIVISPSQMTPTVSVSPNSSTINAQQSLQVTISVGGGNGNATPTGSVSLASGSYSYPPVALNVGRATITIPAGSLPVGSDTLTVTYLPDAASAATYNSALGMATITVTNLLPSFSISGNSVTLAAGASSGNTSTVTVTPFGGFSGSVTLTAQVTAAPATAQSAPAVLFGATSPVAVASNQAATAILTIETTARTSSSIEVPGRPTGRWYAAGGATLACVLLFGVPVRRRRWRSLLGLVALFIAVSAGATACTGGNAGINSAFAGAGTTAGNYTITVTGISGTTVATGTISLTVQ